MSNPTSNFGWQMPTPTDLVTDLPADFEVFGQAVDTDFADLNGGTTGQILSKTSATDLDFTWINNDQGDITGVTAGTGISGGGTSGTVTVTNSMATAIDAKGDLIAGTGADAFSRLAIGSNATVLTADSAEATGMKWASAASAATAYTLINTSGTALTGASTITVSGLSGYNEFYVFVDGASATGAAMNLQWNFNGDSSGNYARSGFWQGWGTNPPTGAATRSAGGSSIIAGQNNVAADTVFATLRISGANSTQIKPYLSYGTGGTGTNSEGWFMYGHYKGTSVISTISIISSSGNFDAGTIYVYGA